MRSAKAVVLLSCLAIGLYRLWVCFALGQCNCHGPMHTYSSGTTLPILAVINTVSIDDGSDLWLTNGISEVCAVGGCVTTQSTNGISKVCTVGKKVLALGHKCHGMGLSAPSFGTSSNENFLSEKVSKRISTNFSCKPDFIPQRLQLG